jgi:cytochrome P450 family 4 subfamily V/cytochrome P450 family 4
LAELDEVFGTNTSCTISIDHIRRLKYMDLVIKETMRMHPPAVFLVRNLDAPLHLPVEEGRPQYYELVKDAWVIIDICGLHSDEKWWNEPQVMSCPYPPCFGPLYMQQACVGKAAAAHADI